MAVATMSNINPSDLEFYKANSKLLKDFLKTTKKNSLAAQVALAHCLQLHTASNNAKANAPLPQSENGDHFFDSSNFGFDFPFR